MSLSNLDSNQITCLLLLTVIVATMLIFCVFKPKFIDQVDVWLTAKFLQHYKQGQAKQAQWRADHPPKRTPEETAFLYFKISFLTIISCFIGLLVLCVICLLQDRHELGPVEQIIAITLWMITMLSLALGIYNDTDPFKKENTATPTTEIANSDATITEDQES